jgi:hypothetical protein
MLTYDAFAAQTSWQVNQAHTAFYSRNGGSDVQPHVSQVTFLPFNHKMRASSLLFSDYPDPSQLVVMPDGAVLKLLKLLDGGGQGSVHKARRMDTVGDGKGYLAVKLPKENPGIAPDRAAVLWFYQLQEELEYYLQAGSHPYIIKVRQAFLLILPDGCTFCANCVAAVDRGLVPCAHVQCPHLNSFLVGDSVCASYGNMQFSLYAAALLPMQATE